MERQVAIWHGERPGSGVGSGLGTNWLGASLAPWGVARSRVAAGPRSLGGGQPSHHTGAVIPVSRPGSRRETELLAKRHVQHRVAAIGPALGQVQGAQ